MALNYRANSADRALNKTRRQFPNKRSNAAAAKAVEPPFPNPGLPIAPPGPLWNPAESPEIPANGAYFLGAELVDPSGRFVASTVAGYVIEVATGDLYEAILEPADPFTAKEADMRWDDLLAKVELLIATGAPPTPSPPPPSPLPIPQLLSPSSPVVPIKGRSPSFALELSHSPMSIAHSGPSNKAGSSSGDSSDHVFSDDETEPLSPIGPPASHKFLYGLELEGFSQKKSQSISIHTKNRDAAAPSRSSWSVGDVDIMDAAADSDFVHMQHIMSNSL
jgi:hypothetical protein